jgi:hypothetical protein
MYDTIAPIAPNTLPIPMVPMDRAAKLQRRIDLANAHGLTETAFMYSEALRVNGTQPDYIQALKGMSDVEVNRLSPAAYRDWSKAIRLVDVARADRQEVL